MSDAPRTVTILGATGSIGTQALDVIARNPGRFVVVGLAAGGKDPALLAEQALVTGARTVAVAQASAAQDVLLALYAAAQRHGYAEGAYELPRLLTGPDAATQLAAEPVDVCLNAMVGSIGLAPTLAALRAGSTLLPANKESLIAGGPLIAAATVRPGQLVAIDSEHSALAQCLRGGREQEVARLVLTASGGPFRGRSRAELAGVTVKQALAHPTWSMGMSNTLNSATLINKGLELIEAHLLFRIGYDAIDVVVHPESLVHSMVEFVDGSTIAQLSPPDMRLAIALALGWPDRVADAAPAMDWTRPHALHFEPLDSAAFPAVELAREAGRRGGVVPTAYNAANETAVAAFVDGALDFAGIVETVASVVEETEDVAAADLGLTDVLAAEDWARRRAREMVEAR